MAGTGVVGELRRLTAEERRQVGRERLAHGLVLALKRQVVDAQGAIGSPFVALSTLVLLERNGTITAAQRIAGDRFHDCFRRAALDRLHALSLDGIVGASVGEAECHVVAERARRRIGKAIRLLGGSRALPADCAWHVLGLEWSLREWARKRLHGGHVMASGVLVAALSIIEPEFSA